MKRGGNGASKMKEEWLLGVSVTNIFSNSQMAAAELASGKAFADTLPSAPSR
ncbi:hypothetical protein I79_012702 [Cricetulus griseus]|uniref:Uncharacterized protein n=1 Tax=Cricetulus griseus TaxID=10029 RepID=G3HPI9_CRIGR|nr:hypothetical protein I79_012702 [Cricetulus griseus]